MKIIYNTIIPPKGYRAINLFGVLFARKGASITEVTLTHESIHTQQMKEMLYIPFYIWYVVEFLFKLLYYFNWKKAYRNISFEREAFYYQGESYYLYKRKHYEWIKHVFKGYD